MSSHLRKNGRRAWADWNMMDMKLKFDIRQGHKAELVRDGWWKNWLDVMNDNCPKETLNTLPDGRGFIARGWLGVVSPEVLSFRKRGPPMTANHFNRLTMIQWGVMTKASYVFWSEKRKFSFFSFPFLLLLPIFSTKMKNKVHPTRTTFSSFQWKKLLLGCASFVFFFLVQKTRRKS